MTTIDKIWATIGVVVLVWLMILLTLWLFYAGEFEGYYCYGNEIYASYTWHPDENAGNFNKKRWEYIVENNLHLEKKVE